jgi:hypothetical protein
VESDTDPRKEKAIEEFLNSSINSASANIWEHDFLVRFLDVAPDQSIMSKIRIHVMSDKVRILLIRKPHHRFLTHILSKKR